MELVFILLKQAYHARGDISKALELHETGTRLFHDISNPVAIAKQRGNLGALWIEVGRMINTGHYFKSMKSETWEDIQDSSLCLWGPPRIDGVNGMLLLIT